MPETPGASGPTLPTQDDSPNVERVDLQKLQNGVFSLNVGASRRGHDFRTPGGERLRVRSGEEPGRLSSPAKEHHGPPGVVARGGITDRGFTSRVQIIRVVSGQKKKISVKLTDAVLPGDTIVVRERFF